MAASTRASKRHSSFTGLHFFTIRADARTGGRAAYVNCWIDFRWREGALVLAKFYIGTQGWRCRAVMDYRWVQSAADVPSRARRYFREAKKDGASFVIHSFIHQTSIQETGLENDPLPYRR